ncbi:MAG TPA: PspC domain-containing protein [Dehalococcoidia bacterium]|nr:PspC domain-containing protein [Dehalococcoidia bacterium]
MTGEPKRLYRSRSDRKIAGVLGGIAEYFSVDPSWVRIAYVILMIVTGVVPLAFLYIVMMFVVPKAPKTKTERGG